MLCPCCGDEFGHEASQCGCGARFVGSPLDHEPVRVQQFGPLMIAVLLFLTVIGASLVLTKWMALAGIIAIWAAWRAMRLARSKPEDYGGYRTATVLLVITATSGAVASGFGIAYIPKYFDNLEIRQQAGNEAIIRHFQGMIEEHKLANGSYPDSEKFPPSSMPKDYWGNPLVYVSISEVGSAAVASSDPAEKTSSEAPRRTLRRESERRGVTGVPFTNFTLKSAGPDGKMDTEDDMVMRDGVFVTNTEVKR